MGVHQYEYHWYEHPGIGRVELKRSRTFLTPNPRQSPRSGGSSTDALLRRTEQDSVPHPAPEPPLESQINGTNFTTHPPPK